MRAFLITGLPRSRTLWLAEFMSYGQCICVHEPSEYMRRIEDLKTVYKDNQGVSDAGLGFWLEWILKEISPWTVIVHRDIKQVERSLHDLYPELPQTNFCELLMEKLNQCRSHPLVMNVSFDALNDMRIMQKVFWHLRPGVPFDEERYRTMNRQIIEVDPVAKFESAQHATMYQEIMPFIKIREQA